MPWVNVSIIKSYFCLIYVKSGSRCVAALLLAGLRVQLCSLSALLTHGNRQQLDDLAAVVEASSLGLIVLSACRFVTGSNQV